jgi:hypothetical protein
MRRNEIMRQSKRSISTFFEPTLSVLCLAVLCAVPAWAQQRPSQPEVLSNAVANEPVHFDVSPPLREMVANAKAPAQGGTHEMEAPLRPKLDQMKAAAQQGIPRVNGALATSPGPLISATIGLSFEGVGNTSVLNCPNVAGEEVAPPDTNAAVGDTQVVEWVNLCYEVFNKSTGALILGPISGNDYWAGFGGGCQTDNDGDIIIQWDKTNHVWLASQNDFGPGFGGPYQTCIAVSQTADATGSYYRYSFPQPGFPDYPKWGLTPSIYYQNQNDFSNGSAFVGVNVCAYEASAMLKGSSKAQQICILDSSNGTLFDDSFLPADLDSDPKPKGVAP